MVHPEEFKRQVVSIISQYNFAPTELAKQNLLREGKKMNRFMLREIQQLMH